MSDPVLGTCRWWMHPDYLADEPHPKLKTCLGWVALPVQTDEPPTGIQKYTKLHWAQMRLNGLWLCRWCGCAVYDRQQHNLACVPSAAYYQSREGR